MKRSTWVVALATFVAILICVYFLLPQPPSESSALAAASEAASRIAEQRRAEHGFPGASGYAMSTTIMKNSDVHHPYRAESKVWITWKDEAGRFGDQTAVITQLWNGDSWAVVSDLPEATR